MRAILRRAKKSKSRGTAGRIGSRTRDATRGDVQKHMAQIFAPGLRFRVGGLVVEYHPANLFWHSLLLASRWRPGFDSRPTHVFLRARAPFFFCVTHSFFFFLLDRLPFPLAHNCTYLFSFGLFFLRRNSKETHITKTCPLGREREQRRARARARAGRRRGGAPAGRSICTLVPPPPAPHRSAGRALRERGRRAARGCRDAPPPTEADPALRLAGLQ